jgi:Uma2 family endonuclease
MSIARQKPATYADLEAVPDTLVAEILFGNLVTHPRPTFRHGGATSALGMVAGGAYQFGNGGPGGWIFIDEPELHLGPHIVVPDIAGWRRERLSVPNNEAHLSVAPEWVYETLSPSTEKYDKGPKRTIYGQFGVGHLWYIDPRAKSLECFALHERDWVLKGTFFDSETVCMPPFEALTFSLGLLWPFDPPAPAK